MTEAEWLACDDRRQMLYLLRSLTFNDPQEAVPLLKAQTVRRKSQLFAVACCRRIWTLFADERNRHAVEVAERFADGQASEAERAAANAASYSVYENTSPPASGFPDAAQGINRSEWEAAQAATGVVLPFDEAAEAIRCADVVGEQIIEAIAEEAKGKHSVRVVADYATRSATTGENAAQAHLLRCVFGNPFRPVPFAPAWRTPEVTALATAIYEERAFDRLPILGDALEDAGCTDAAILEHCRGPGPHVRGCWVVDLILGKS
jgi:hypothetical protein